MSESNKRKYPRVEGKGVAAYLRLNGHNAGCTVQNISVGGIFVRTDRFLPVGTKLAFDLIKPGMKKALTVSGWVVGVITAELAARTKLPQGLRIQFAKLTPSASEALQELVGSLRRTPGAEPPVLYPLEPKPKPSRSLPQRGPTRAGSEARRAAQQGPPLSKRIPSRVLGDDPPNSTEVEMEARPGPGDPGKEDPSLVRKWFAEGEATDFGGDRGSGDQPVIDDSLIGGGEEPQPEPESEEEGPPSGEEWDPEMEREADQDPPEDQPDEEAPPEEDEEEAAAGAPSGPNPFDDEDKTIGVEPTRPKARYGEGESAKRPTAPRPPPSRARPELEEHTPAEQDAGHDEDELASANRELQRLLERREGEIAALRAQVAKLEASLKDREEQLQLAKRVLRTNGLG
jgi:hypothetical protein